MTDTPHVAHAAVDHNALWPYWTASWPGLGGRIRQQPEDFEVEELPAYEPCGAGEHLFLWIEKRNVGAEHLLRRVAQCLSIPTRAVGMAGLKDRHALTRQWLSVPQHCWDRLDALYQLAGEGIHLLRVARHRNKLKPGHLRGNRFRILIRDADRSAPWAAMIECIRRMGLPNYYGPQRFGRQGSTLQLGWQCLLQQRLRIHPFRFRLALSAVQSFLFNQYLAQRQRDGLLRTVIDGDVMAHWPVGGLFRAQNVAAEQARLESRQIIPAGPIFGWRTYPATGVAARREQALLHHFGLSAESFDKFGKLLSGTRRHIFIYLDDLQASWESEGLRLQFTLPAGSYATVLLRELMKNKAADTAADAQEDVPAPES
jgi:tRNA pseudouridine13 synthase